MGRYLDCCMSTLLVFAGCGGEAASDVPSHPVFDTPLSGQSHARPALQVDIKDASEDIFFTAELYIAVQSSRFPQDTWVLLPLNVGDFAGSRTRFVQLPFEVQPNDTLLFNLLDNDKLSREQERLVLKGCRSAGYCLLVAGAIYCPQAAHIARPVVPVASEVLGQAVISEVGMHYFENFGTAEYIVPPILPNTPHAANELSVRSESNYVPAVLKLYGPSDHLIFEYEAGGDD